MDLRIIYVQDVLPIRDVAYLDGSTTQVVIRGTDFDSAAQVLINRVPAPSFSVMSRVKILATVPEGIGTDPIQDVAVLSNKFTVTDRSRLKIEIGNTPQYISGLMRLVQRFIKLLLRNPGSDIDNPKLGGGMGAIINQFIISSTELNKSDVALAVRRAERQMRRLQSTMTSLSDDERLLSADLEGVEVSQTSGALLIRIELLSQTGESARTMMEA